MTVRTLRLGSAHSSATASAANAGNTGSANATGVYHGPVLLVLAEVALLAVVLARTLGENCPNGTTRTKGVCTPNSQLR
jgi:hypothetical protein